MAIGIPSFGGGGLAKILEMLQNPGGAATSIAQGISGGLPGLSGLAGATGAAPILPQAPAPAPGGVPNALPGPVPITGSTDPRVPVPGAAAAPGLASSLGGLLNAASALVPPEAPPLPPSLPTAPGAGVSVGGPATTGNVAELLKLLQPGQGAGGPGLGPQVPSLAQLLGGRR